jgi:L-iditol 2-dehydrogenase
LPEKKNKMNAAVFYGPDNIVNEHIYYNYDDKAGGVSLRVNACTVCGYDARVFRNGHQKVTPPVILGHEICGQIDKDVVVSKTSEGVKTPMKIKAGSRVAVSSIIPCLNCNYCYNKEYNLCINLKEIGSSINGGFAEYVRIPEQVLRIGGLVLVPNNLNDEEAALLEPLACCLNGFSHIRRPLGSKTTVAVVGDGPIGLLHLQISKRLYNTRTVVVGKIPQRIEIAKSLGADTTVTLPTANDSDDNRNRNRNRKNNNNYIDGTNNAIKDLLDFSNGVGVNIIIIATSNPAALEFALKIASKGSTINIFAGLRQSNFISLDPNWVHYNQISITGSFSSTPNLLQQAATLASQGRINLSRMITHRYSLNEIKEAMVATEKYYGLRAVINEF